MTTQSTPFRSLKHQLRSPHHQASNHLCQVFTDFTSLMRTVYVYTRRLKRFYAALMVCVASLLFVIIWPAAGGDTVGSISNSGRLLQIM